MMNHSWGWLITKDRQICLRERITEMRSNDTRKTQEGDSMDSHSTPPPHTHGLSPDDTTQTWVGGGGYKQCNRMAGKDKKWDETQKQTRLKKSKRKKTDRNRKVKQNRHRDGPIGDLLSSPFAMAVSCLPSPACLIDNHPAFRLVGIWSWGAPLDPKIPYLFFLQVAPRKTFKITGGDCWGGGTVAVSAFSVFVSWLVAKHQLPEAAAHILMSSLVFRSTF